MNPKKNIPHPETKRGGANALLLFILAFIAASFTLLAATSNTGEKYASIYKDSQCTFGKTEYSTNSQGNVTSCQRPYLSMQKCKPCSAGENPNACDCKQTCVPNGSWQTGIYLAPNATITFTNTLNGGGKLEAAWDKYISATINKDGKTAYVYTVTGKGDPQCLFPPK
jgi:hypothetical protein